MILEELIARIGFRSTGNAEAKRFISDIQKMRDELKKLQSTSKGLNISFGARASKDLDRATASARNYRRELERANKVRPGRSGGGGGRVGPGYVPGRSVEDRMPHRGGRSVAGGVLAGNLLTGIVRDTARIVAKPLITFANEETARKQVSLTAGVSEDRVSKDFEEFRKIGPQLGVAPKKLLEVVNGYVAAGLTYAEGVKAAIPTVKAAKAGSADIDDVTKAGVASINNLGIKAEDIGKAFDIMLASGKSGQIELKDLASVLPETAAAAQNAGYKDLPGLTKLTSQLQFARKGTSTAGEAATNASNFFGKVFAEVTIKAFKEAGIDIVKKIKEGEKKGINASDVTLAEAKKYAKGDPFKMKELFGDVQAGAFLQQMLKNEEGVKANIEEVNKTAPGSVDKDFATMMDRLAGSAEKLSAAFDRLMGRVGEYGSGAAKQIADESAGMLGTADEIQARARLGWQPAEAMTPEQMEKRLLELNPTPLSTSAKDFRNRFGAARPSSVTPSFMRPQPTGLTAPTLGSLANRMDWTKQGADRAGTTITNTNTGNDQRTQSVTVNQTVNGVAGVAASAAAGAKEGLASMGASIVKANSIPTGGGTAGSSAP
jgi:TP901 family phage tail tape measure protein